MYSINHHILFHHHLLFRNLSKVFKYLTKQFDRDIVFCNRVSNRFIVNKPTRLRYVYVGLVPVMLLSQSQYTAGTHKVFDIILYYIYIFIRFNFI